MAYDIFGSGGTIDGTARAAINSHTLRVDNPHSVTKAQVGLSDVVNVDTTTTSNIIDSTDKRFVSDAQKAVLNTTSGTNTGDENTTTIINKIGYTPENTLNKGVNNGYCGLDSGGKVPLQNLPSTLLKYIGTWNAETNIPNLNTTDLTKVSHVYVVSHDGTQFGIIWKAGDWLIYDVDGIVEKSDNSDDVVSVNGKTGIVIIDKADVGLSNVDNTRDLDKPISNLTQTALNLKADSTIVTTHTTNTNNPHSVTKTQVGLNNVNNTSDIDKPISTLTQTALNLKADKSGLTTHTNNTSNPHAVTKTQIGLSNVVDVNTTTTTNITDSTDKRFITDVQRTLLNNTSGSNTGDETTSTIKTKLGSASTTTDGYLTKEDFTTFNNKANIGEVTPISHATNTSNPHGVTKTQVGLSNVVNIDTTTTANITDTPTKRFVTDTEKTIWNVKRDVLPEGIQRATSSVEWRSIAYGNGVFVAVGTNRVMRSADGVNGAPVFVANVWTSIVFGNGMFVAVASHGTNRVMRSTDGITWSAINVEGGEFSSVTYGNGIFIAVASTGTNRVMSSPDGVNWTPVLVELSSWWSITYGNGMFVAVAPFGTNRVMRSTDGVTWTAASVESSEWRSVAYGNGMFIAVALVGTNRVMRSTDGVTWTATTLVASGWRSVTYGNGVFIAVASTGSTRMAFSTDGTNWYYKNIPSVEWYTITYADGMFIGLANNTVSGMLTIGERTYSDKGRVVSKSVIGELSASILSTEWTGTGPFEDTIPITIAGEQITNTTHDIKVSLALSSDINIAKQEQEAYSYFSKGEISATNTLKITCFEYKPTVNLNLTLEVVKKW